jgi:hypothetical protein
MKTLAEKLDSSHLEVHAEINNRLDRLERQLGQPKAKDNSVALEQRLSRLEAIESQRQSTWFKRAYRLVFGGCCDRP